MRFPVAAKIALHTAGAMGGCARLASAGEARVGAQLKRGTYY